MSSTTRYKALEERDAALDAQFHPHMAGRAHGTSVLAYVGTHLPDLTDEFLTARSGGGAETELHDAVQSWLATRFGHATPVMVGLLLRQVMLYTVNEWGHRLRRGTPVGLSRWQQARLEEAVRAEGGCPSGGDAEGFMRRVCARAGLQIGDGVQSMPEVRGC